MSRRSPSQQGFTLIEMLVAVGLLSLLGIASALALNSALRSQTIIGDKQTSLEHLQRSQRLLSRDIEQLVLRQGRDLYGDPLAPALIANNEANASEEGLLLQFFKTGRRMLNRSAIGSTLEQVRYRVEDDQLLRETSSVLDPSVTTPWHSSAILSDITELRLRFFHGNQWHSQWPPLSTAGAAPTAGASPMPKAIEIQLQTLKFTDVTQLILIPGDS
ncbi:MAG: type II secretion system minor pseudopilin GspJ [Halopseudomonas sp.]